MKPKKVLAALLVIAMIMSVFTVMAFANETLAVTPNEEGGTYTLNYIGADSEDVIENQTVYMVSDGFYQNAANFSSSTTFYITGYEGLLYFRKLVNNEDGVADAYAASFTTGSTANLYQSNIFTGKTVHLLADIDLENKGWNKAIGYVHTNASYDKMLFYGIFDGHNHTVYNLSISSDSDNNKNEYGFFGRLGATAGQTIKNLTLKNVSISGGSYVGGFAGNAQSNVINFENCHLNGLININGSFAGGLCGIGSANFVDCAVNADDESIIDGTSFTGGIIASERCSDSSLNVSGNSVSNISIRSVQYAGGIIGGMASGAKGNISITDNQVSDLIITTYSSYPKDPGAIIGGNSEGYTTVSLSGNMVSDTTVSKQCGWSTVSIEDSEYESLEKAIEVATDGDVITLLQDINITAEEFTGTNYYTVDGKDITIDLNGCDIIAEADTNSAHNLFFVKNGAALSIKDTSEAADGVISYEFKGENNGWKQQATIYSNGNVSIYSGTIKNITDEDATSGMSFTIDEHPNQWGDTYTNLNPTFHMYGGYVYTLMGEAVRIANYGTNNPDIVTHGIVDGGKIEGWDALFIQYANTTARQLDVKINGGELIGENAGVRFYSPAITAVDGNTAKPLTVEYNGGKIKTLNPNARPTEYNGAMIIQNTSNIEAPEAITAYADISVKEGYYVAALADNWYELKQGDANIINKDAVLGTTIELNQLAKQGNIDVQEDATYKVVVNTPSATDKEKAETAIAENSDDTNSTTVVYDVKVEKTDSNGTKTYVNGIEYQPVTITLSENIKENTDVFVYHVTAAGDVEQITVADNGLAYSGNTITFIAPSFSTYAVTYTADDVIEDNITKNIGVAFEMVQEGEYDIVLTALDNKTINRFMSATIAFKLTGTNIAYEIEPAAYVNLEEVEAGTFRFNMDGINHPYASGAKINIGKVYFTGYGDITFKVDSDKTLDDASGIAVNIVNTAKAVDNIVDKYTPVGDASATPKLTINEDVDTVSGGESTGVIDATLAKNTKNLTINVKFNNIISDNAATYQDMKVTVSGGDLTSAIVKNFGSDGEIALNGDTYTVEIADTLTQNVNYTVKVEGAGYRTARHTVTMTENKVLNFWNNVKDSANATVIEIGKAPMTKNFLAGDIVKDNNINIYDLSAVVSYFGTENLVSAYPAYAKYDLNRDGVIDSKDVAYVLVSWGE